LGLLAVAVGLHAVGLRWLDGHAILDVMLASPSTSHLLVALLAVVFMGLRLVLLVLGPGLAVVGLVRLASSLVPTRR
jgi:hypothetical protein